MSSKPYIAYFRFYEELNDFLPKIKRKRQFLYAFRHPMQIRAILKQLGVPLSEIDLILINGKSVAFTYVVQNKDRISVYPMFETLDIAKLSKVRSQPLRQPKFVLDVHLGRLGKYLRILGIDCLYEPTYADAEIIYIARKEQRTILTRDKLLLTHKAVTHGYWVRQIAPKQQLQEILQRFDLYQICCPLSRCLECNGLITTVSKQAVESRLPPQTKRFYQEFFICQHCNKVYWRGSHYQAMLKFAVEQIHKKGH